MTEGKNTQFFSFNNIIAILIILLISGAGIRYFSINQSARIFEKYYEFAENNYASFRGGSAVTDVNLMKALTFFEAGDFEASSPLFSKYLLSTPEDFDATFLAGISFLETQQIKKAILAFKSARINSPRHYENATWYLALTYLKKDEKEKARAILQELVTQKNGTKKNEAERLLIRIS